MNISLIGEGHWRRKRRGYAQQLSHLAVFEAEHGEGAWVSSRKVALRDLQSVCVRGEHDAPPRVLRLQLQYQVAHARSDRTNALNAEVCVCS
eukprot:CAMPEP_0174708804 /NCGR_PEP_ID=MMETSP1094-20130205/10960_1 /TAXON_ID=156173 /ORGANISM="Chrysochromulina brevifilum, Strain UTEX LB 985" /LENGTH=91 /DNA_ID=CAMNT_0015907413 /DNA_START=126 /DNA_END=401 /DNA_ORIENTATION=+